MVDVATVNPRDVSVPQAAVYGAAKKENTSGIPLVMDVFGTLTGLTEVRMNEKLEDIKRSNAVLKDFTELRQILRFKSDDPSKTVDLSEYQELIDRCVQHGLKIKNGTYEFTDSQMKNIMDSAEELSNSIQSITKADNIDLQRLQGLQETFYTVWMKALKSLLKTLQEIAEHIGR